MLILGTARPDLFERRPAFASNAANASRIHLVALADAETTALAKALLGDLAVPDDVRTSVARRAGGNPLFIGEVVRLLRDRAIDASEVEGANASDASASDEGLRIPSSIQAVIAARLDALSPATKSLLADAAVVGGVFWSGALVAMGDRSPGEVADGLRQLEARELVHASKQSSVAGQDEYAFAHALTRDVAYAQLPRASRAARHVTAAGWIEALAAGRTEDVADVLAYHYTTALELAQATGQAGAGCGPGAAGSPVPHARRRPGAEPRRSRGRVVLRAGIGVDPDLETRDSRPHSRDFGVAASQAGRHREAVEALDAAVGLYRDVGRRRRGSAHAQSAHPSTGAPGRPTDMDAAQPGAAAPRATRAVARARRGPDRVRRRRSPAGTIRGLRRVRRPRHAHGPGARAADAGARPRISRPGSYRTRRCGRIQ